MSGKLGTRFRSVNLLATFGLSLCLTACLHPARTVQQLDAMRWSGTLDNAQRTPFLAERVPMNPEIRWEQRFGRGFTDVPVVHGDVLIATSTAKTVTVAHAGKGSRYWERRLNGVIAGALIRLNERIYLATQSRDGRVEALSLARGRHAWTFKLHAPAMGGALLVDSTLFVGSERAELFALGIADGRQQWRVHIPAPITATPVAWGSELIVVTTRDSLLRIDRATGRQSPGMHLAGSISAPIALQGDRLLVALQPGLLQAIHLPDLRIEWTARVESPMLAAPALDANGDIYVLTRTADVWRIQPNGETTRIAQLGGAAAASLTLTADGLLVGKLDGTAVLLARDGREQWRKSFTHSIRTPIAVRDGSLFVPLGDGHLVMLR